MIDPKLLTEENGFQKGVVLLWTDHDDSQEIGILEEINYHGVGGIYLLSKYVRLDLIKSIKVLTSPMSIWNQPFPPKAQWCTFNGFSYTFHESDQFLGAYSILMKRPFWA